MGNIYRDMTLENLDESYIGKELKVAGWVENIRDHGGVSFIDLRDMYGVLQVVIRDTELLKGIKKEESISVEGLMEQRDEETYNPKIKSGTIELEAHKITTLGQVYTQLPFEIQTSKEVREDVRLKYRYLDLRNEKVKIEEQENTNCFYFIATDKIILNKDKKYFTRVQTIAHECIHSIQDKKILWFNYIFANLLNVFWLITIVLTIAGVITQYALFSAIILICIIIFYAIRSYLEIEAMTKAKYIAKEYLEEKQVKETDEIVEEYEKLNDVGIKYTCYKLISSKLYLLAILGIILCKSSSLKLP